MKYRKITPTLARKSTIEDHQMAGGIIHTLEGPAPFQVGDYIAKDKKGSWPIKAAILEDPKKYWLANSVDRYTFSEYISLEQREAVEMPITFTVGGKTGKPGDFLVITETDAWPVDRGIFLSTYAQII